MEDTKPYSNFHSAWPALLRGETVALPTIDSQELQTEPLPVQHEETRAVLPCLLCNGRPALEKFVYCKECMNKLGDELETAEQGE